MDLIFFLVLLLATFAIGNYLERRHFKDIERRERRARNIIVTTFETIPEDWEVERAELVSGSVVVSLDYFKRFLAGLRALVGGRVKSYEPLMDRARREAVLRMLEEAHGMGFRHVINVRLETTRLATGRRDGKGTAGVEIFAYGTGLGACLVEEVVAMRAVPRVPDASPNVSKTHPLGEAAWLVAGIGGVVLLAFLLIAFFVEIAVSLVPVEAEARMLSGLLAGFEDDVHEEPELDALMGRLAAHWPENPYEFRLQILESPEPNAMALPGGSVLVTSGLLEQAESENELAFVLAHEVGHYRDRDHLKLLGRGVLFQVVLATIGIGGGPDAARVASASALLSDRSFSRGQERDADAFALGLVQAEYGHINGADDFFERLGAEESATEELVANFSGTHPGMEDRVEELAVLAAERGWASTGELTPLGGDLAVSGSRSGPDPQESPPDP